MSQKLSQEQLADCFTHVRALPDGIGVVKKVCLFCMTRGAYNDLLSYLLGATDMLATLGLSTTPDAHAIWLCRSRLKHILKEPK